MKTSKLNLVKVIDRLFYWIVKGLLLSMYSFVGFCYALGFSALFGMTTGPFTVLVAAIVLIVIGVAAIGLEMFGISLRR